MMEGSKFLEVCRRVEHLRGLHAGLRQALGELGAELRALPTDEWPLRDCIKWAKENPLAELRVAKLSDLIGSLEFAFTQADWPMQILNPDAPCDEDGIPL